MSAGIQSVGIDRRFSGLVTVFITPTLLATNYLNSRLRPQIQHQTFALSVQKMEILFETFAILEISQILMTASISPKRVKLVVTQRNISQLRYNIRRNHLLAYQQTHVEK